MRLPLITALFIALLALSTPTRAEQAQQFDHYEVHYNAFNSSFLPPEVALAYNLQRSKSRGLINVAVLDTATGKRPTSAIVKGSFKNLLSQQQTLSFREIREGNAIYYLAEFRFTDDELLMFTVEVQPDPNRPAYSVNFKQHFYVD
ncbi:MAG TPA: DUF4426 domain-containing protein [Motiliproteus sp.]